MTGEAKLLLVVRRMRSHDLTSPSTRTQVRPCLSMFLPSCHHSGLGGPSPCWLSSSQPA